MLTILGRRQTTCQGTSRRKLLQAGGAGLLGLTLPGLLRAEEAGSGAAADPASLGPQFDFERGRAKSVIFLFLFGGPSQLETFDMKPDAPSEIRGPFQPTPARNPDLRISEYLPRCAAISDKYAVIKTMSHSYNDHSGGAHYIQTGHRWRVPIGGGFNVTPNDWPSMGSVVKHCDLRLADRQQDIPPYVVLPNFLGRLQEYRVQLRRPGETAGWLGRSFDPLNTKVDKRDAKDNPYFRDCTDEELTYAVDGLASLDGLTLDRMHRRRSLLEQFNEQVGLAEKHLPVAAYDQFQQQAFDLVTSEKTRRAFRVQDEPDALRDQYGRNLFGQSTLVARRLVEAGVRFVTVHYDCVDGYSWDSHRSSKYLKDHLIPGLDNALATLLADLDQRGLLDETLVVAMGEMGRTPKANGSWGRNHWSTLFPAVLAGAGVRGGMIYGETDRDAAYATSSPTSPEDLAATIYHALGIPPQMRILDTQSRPHPLLETGQPLVELFEA